LNQVYQITNGINKFLQVHENKINIKQPLLAKNFRDIQGTNNKKNNETKSNKPIQSQKENNIKNEEKVISRAETANTFRKSASTRPLKEKNNTPIKSENIHQKDIHKNVASVCENTISSIQNKLSLNSSNSRLRMERNALLNSNKLQNKNSVKLHRILFKENV